MHLDPSTLRVVAVGVAVLLLYGSGLTKDSIVQTTGGMVFRSKPLFACGQAIILPTTILFFAHLMGAQKQLVQWGMMMLVIGAIAVGLTQMPGTITLTPTAITQRFWFQPSKTIQYNEVMGVQRRRGGSMTRIVGDNRVNIAHTSNHCAATEFQQELERRNGKRVVT